MPTQPYYVHGVRVPSVTTVLGRVKDSDALIAWANRIGLDGITLAEARKLGIGPGNIVHDRAFAENTGQTWEPPADVEPEIMARAEQGWSAYRDWLAHTDLRVVAAEVPLVHDGLLYGGTIDAICEGPMGRAILDYKTSNAIYPEYAAQVAAYAAMWQHARAQDVRYGYIIRFGKEHGDFEMRGFPASLLEQAFDVFRIALDFYRASKKLAKVVR